MLTYAHTCSHMLTHARPPAGRHVHTCSHMFTHIHTCAHTFTHAHICSHLPTRLHTCSHMCTHAYTCSHMLHMETRFPFLLSQVSGNLHFQCVLQWFLKALLQNRSANFQKIAKTLGPFNKNSTSKFAHSCTQPQVGQHAPKRPQGGPQAALQKWRKRKDHSSKKDSGLRLAR